jgi:hypothetical protein
VRKLPGRLRDLSKSTASFAAISTRQVPDFPASWFLLRQLPGRLRDLSKSTTSFAAISARQTPLISARLSAQISPLHLTLFSCCLHNFFCDN